MFFSSKMSPFLWTCLTPMRENPSLPPHWDLKSIHLTNSWSWYDCASPPTATQAIWNTDFRNKGISVEMWLFACSLEKQRNYVFNRLQTIESALVQSSCFKFGTSCWYSNQIPRVLLAFVTANKTVQVLKVMFSACEETILTLLRYIMKSSCCLELENVCYIPWKAKGWEMIWE